MPDYLIRWNSLDQLDLIVRLKIGHLVLNLPNDLEVSDTEHELHIDVDGDGNLAHRVLDQQDQPVPP